MTAELKAGDKAPDFDLPTDGAGRVSLAELKGKTVVLYFYPKDDTTGCTSRGPGLHRGRRRLRQGRRGGGRGLQGLRSPATRSSRRSTT